MDDGCNNALGRMYIDVYRCRIYNGLQKFDVQWAFILEQNRCSSEVHVREVTVYVSY